MTKKERKETHQAAKYLKMMLSSGTCTKAKQLCRYGCSHRKLNDQLNCVWCLFSPAGSESCSSVGSSSSSLSRPQLPLPPPTPTWSAITSLPVIGPLPPLPTDTIKSIPQPQQPPPNQEVANYYILEASGILVSPHAGEQPQSKWLFGLIGQVPNATETEKFG